MEYFLRGADQITVSSAKGFDHSGKRSLKTIRDPIAQLRASCKRLIYADHSYAASDAMV